MEREQHEGAEDTETHGENSITLAARRTCHAGRQRPASLPGHDAQGASAGPTVFSVRPHVPRVSALFSSRVLLFLRYPDKHDRHRDLSSRRP